MAAAPAPTAGPPLAASLQPVDGLPPPDLSMPALEPVKNRETYRVRPEDELEEATWYSAEEPDTLAEPTSIRLRSIHSKQATVITFANKSAYRVRALWIDFTGNEVVYSVLEPGTTRRYHTYVTHPWIVRELRSGTRMLLSGRPSVVGMSIDQTVEIAAPPRLAWSMDTHSCFPEPFKTSIRELIQAHKQLEAYAGSASAAAATPAAAALSCSPLRKLPTTPGAGGDADAVPCSPRATLLQQGHAAALPTSPKARRLSVAPSLLPAASPCAVAGTSCATPRTPRAVSAGSFGSPAAAGDVSTTISISSEASHFTATLTVSSPTRAVLKQTLNIEVFNSPVRRGSGSSASGGPASCSGCGAGAAGMPGSGQHSAPAGGSAVGAAFAGEQAPMSAAEGGSSAPSHRPSSSQAPSSGRKAHRARQGLFTSLMHNFKNAFRPATKQHSRSSSPAKPAMSAAAFPTTTTIKLHVQQQLMQAGSGEDMDVDGAPAPAAEPPCASGATWPPATTHLGDLPNHLLAYIAELAAPLTWQTLAQCPKGRPAIQPTLLACPPESADEQQQEEEQQEDIDADEPPALI